MQIFEGYCSQDKDAKVSLAGDLRYWSWFKILVFTKKKINLIKELESLNNILSKQKGNKYEEFSVCLDEFYLPPKQSFGFISRKKIEAMSFNFMVNFWTMLDQNGSMTWTMTQDKISISYYFNHEIIDLTHTISMIKLLKNFARTYRLYTQGRKLPFTMTVSNSKRWKYDYIKRTEFICRK